MVIRLLEIWKPENWNGANIIAFMDSIKGRDDAQWLYLIATNYTLTIGNY